MPRHAPTLLPVQPPTSLTGPWERWWPVIGALLYAGVLASLPSESLKDRDNYAAHLEYAALALLAWLDRDLLSVLTNEPLFLLLNLALGAMLPVEQSLELLVFVPAAIVAHAVLRTDPRHGVYLLVVLLLPQVLQKHVIHLRQGVAIAMFVVAWFATSPRVRWPLIAMTPFVHASFFFVLMLMGAAWAVRRLRLSPTLVVAAFIVVGVAVGVGLGELVRGSGARQGDEYEFVALQDISGAGFVFWSAVLGLLLMQARRFFVAHVLEIGSVVFYLATYFLSPLTARVFESTMLIVLLSAIRMRGIGRPVFMAVIVLFALLQWLMILMGLGVTFTVNDA